MLPTRISPIRALVSRTPTASGFSSPVDSRAGPRPRKIVRPSPAKLSPVPPRTVPVPKVTLPSIVTKSPMVRVRFDRDTSKTGLEAKTIRRLRPPTSTVSSTAVPTVFRRSRI